MEIYTKRPRNEAGISLIEIMVTVTLLAIILAISFPTLRIYWLKQSLNGAVDAVTTEMSRAQSLVTSESHPLVYGIRFSDAAGLNGEGRWGLIKYDPTGGTGGLAACTQYGTGSFGTGVFNGAVSLSSVNFDGGGASSDQTFCRSNLKDSTGAPIAASSDEFLFFYARGTATGGQLTLHQPTLGADDDITVTVNSLTGRAEAQ